MKDIKLRLDGMLVEDAEAERDITYFICAYYFHWTPAQVDAVEAEVITSLVNLILPIWIRKENEVNTSG